jgi:hypothetical protein
MFAVSTGSTMSVSQLSNYASNTLTGGSFDVSGTLKLAVPSNQSIVTNAATIILDGPSASIIKYADG